MTTQLLAGAAKINITPPVGVDLCGFGARPGPSVGIHDDLRAAALYLKGSPLPGAEAGEVIVITCDLIGLHHEEVQAVRELIVAATGVGGKQVMIGCSHTHAGPATGCLPTLGRPDATYLAVLQRKLAGLARMAKEAAQPAVLGTLREPVAVGINRRERQRDGSTKLGRNERGQIAPYVDVVAVDTVEGAPLARLFVHAAHAVTLGAANQLISADWPGYAQRTLERVYGGQCITLFGQGCCGNINSDPVGTFEIAEAQGRIMAGAVLKAAEYAEKAPEVWVGVQTERLQLPCQDPPPPDVAAATLTRFREAAAQPGLNYGLQYMHNALVAWAERIERLAAAGATGLTLPFEIQALRLGDFALVGLPGEVFVEYALNLDRVAPFGQTATMAYTNGNIGYVPTATAFPEGGYEVDTAIRYYGDTMLTPECEALILAAGARLLKALRPAGT